MKALLIFPGTGPILILTTYESMEESGFIEKMGQKGVTKFIAFEVPLEKARARYGARYDIIAADLQGSEDMRVLDYNSHTAFHNFSFKELGEAVRYEK